VGTCDVRSSAAISDIQILLVSTHSSDTPTTRMLNVDLDSSRNDGHVGRNRAQRSDVLTS